MERFTGLIGIAVIFAIAVLLSDNRRAINKRLVFSGLALQVLLAVLVLKVPFITHAFEYAGRIMTKVQQFATQGAAFVYGGIMIDDHQGASSPFGAPQTFVFAFTVTATIIFVCVLVSVLYHAGIIQRLFRPLPVLCIL